MCSRITVSISVFDVFFLLKLEPPRMWFLNVFEISSCNSITLSSRWPGNVNIQTPGGCTQYQKHELWYVAFPEISHLQKPPKTLWRSQNFSVNIGKKYSESWNFTVTILTWPSGGSNWIMFESTLVTWVAWWILVVTCFCELDTFGKGQMKGPSWLHSQNADSAKRPCWIYLSNTLWISRLLVGREGCSIK